MFAHRREAFRAVAYINRTFRAPHIAPKGHDECRRTAAPPQASGSVECVGALRRANLREDVTGTVCEKCIAYEDADEVERRAHAGATVRSVK